ncbi:hypothetical protein CI1B_32000 [Bradyrhizobium ivorense]|uniref:T6SS Phospholipase effector Tle1-like catalytic domain-containing protein n=1 Tax=Bradyrhizobium ivorense TaxID=2511166 RepID=A0A508T8W6_9BRAD|nr:DUF2235 domain-containing protein [Bradyrhizobium ivorense]VIO70546.1 hypothetical protein CI1B_32000 [Bradyrhizobium ivorense]
MSRAPGRYLNFMLDTRNAIAARFRADHACANPQTGEANVFPYFIGVFDTVAALGNKWLPLVLAFVIVALPVVLQKLAALLAPNWPWTGHLARDLSYLAVVGAALIYLQNYLKIAPRLRGYGFFKRLATLHLTRFKHEFYDKTLNVNVGYAKHAISIDENRADFARVGWQPTDEKLDKRDAYRNLYFEQVWFPGVDANVGGGYLENEARLSDNAMGWMLAAASIIPDGLKHDSSVLRLWPDAAGPQHDEQAGGWLKKGLRDLPVGRVTKTSGAIMHKSVYKRFACDEVQIFDRRGPYRPINMAVHVEFAQYFGTRATNQPAPDPQCVADDIEANWQLAGFPGRLFPGRL